MRQRRPAVEIADTCKLLSNETKPVSRSKVYRLIKEGELEAYKGSGRTSKYYVYVDSIEDYVERQAVVPDYDKDKIRDLLGR